MERSKSLVRFGMAMLVVAMGVTGYVQVTKPIEPFTRLQGFQVVDDHRDIYQMYDKGQFRYLHWVTVKGDLQEVKQAVAEQVCVGDHWHYSKSTDSFVGMFDHYTYEVRVTPGEGGVAVSEDREATSREALMPKILKAFHGTPRRSS